MAENNELNYLLELDELRTKYEKELDDLYIKQSYQLLMDNKYDGFDIFIREQLKGKSVDDVDIAYWIELSELIQEEYSDIILDSLEFEAIADVKEPSVDKSPEPDISDLEGPEADAEPSGDEVEPQDRELVKKVSPANLHLSSKNILYAKKGVVFDDAFIASAAEVLLEKKFEKINIFRPEGYSIEQQNEFVSRLRNELVARGYPSQDISVQSSRSPREKVQSQESTPAQPQNKILSTFDENGRRIVPVRYEPDLSKNLGEHDEMIREIESILKDNPNGITIGKYMSDLADKGIYMHILHVDGNIGYRYYNRDDNTQIAGSRIVQKDDPDTNLYGYGGECLKNFLDDSDDLGEYFKVSIDKAVERITSRGGKPTQGAVNDELKNGRFLFTVHDSAADGWKVNYAPTKKIAVQFDFSELGLSSQNLASFNFADRLSKAGATTQSSESRDEVNSFDAKEDYQVTTDNEYKQASESQSDVKANSTASPASHELQGVESEKNPLPPLDFSSDGDSDLLGEMNSNNAPAPKHSAPKMSQ